MQGRMPGAGSYERHDVITKACQNLYCDDKVDYCQILADSLKIGAKGVGKILEERWN